MANYYSLVTDTGLAKLAAANVSGIPLVISEIALGDGNGAYVAPLAGQTVLNNEIRRDTVNRIYQSDSDPSIFVAEGFLSKQVGGFTIREVGLFDSDGDLIVAAAYPATYKATEAEGGASDMYISTLFKHSNTSDVQISTDPSQILATQAWVNVNTDPINLKLQRVVETGQQSFDTNNAEQLASALIPRLPHIFRTLPFDDGAQLLAADGAAVDHFGYAVTLSGDGNTAIVGAYADDVGGNADQGSAYVFTRTAGVWSEQQQLIASDGVASDQFGYSVTLSSDGNTALVGARFDDVGGNADQGSAYVFIRNGTSWSEQQQLIADDGAADDNFGHAVALSSDGNTALVGARLDDVGSNTDEGSAYVFTRSNGVWTQEDHFSAGDVGDNFGTAVALSADGNTAIIGAPYDDIGTDADQGSAYIFTRSGGVWSQAQKLTASDGAAGDYFGFSVAISKDGNTALVGAYWNDAGGVTDRGAAYAFIRNGTSWAEQQKLTASDGSGSDHFGRVALSGDGNTAIIGASADNVSYGNQGSAYVFSRTAGIWTERQKLTNSDGGASDFFGGAVTISDDGNTALIGARNHDVGANADQGSAYVFTRIMPL